MTKRRPKTREPVAYHEAAHAVIALALDMRLKGVTIIPDLTQGTDGMVSAEIGFRGRPDLEITDRIYVRLQRRIHLLARRGIWATAEISVILGDSLPPRGQRPP